MESGQIPVAAADESREETDPLLADANDVEKNDLRTSCDRQTLHDGGGDVKRRQKWTRARVFRVVLLVFVLLGIGTFVAVEMGPKPPKWTVETIVLDRIDVPGLWIDGLVPANTSGCPMYDPCGSVLAIGCSVCPHAGDLNRGCLCSVEGGTAAMIISADKSACPYYDRCGLYAERGCTECAHNFTKLGCLCHRPLIVDELRRQAVDFMELITGTDEYPLQVRLRTDMLVTNPNYAHAVTKPGGNITVTWNGEVIGSSVIRPMRLDAFRSDEIVLEVDVNQVTKTLGYQMMKELLLNSQLLRLKVEGFVIAQVLALEIKTDILCDIVAEVNMDGTSEIAEQNCSYGYSGLGGILDLEV